MLNPVNRHILVDYHPPQEKTDSGILLPDDYKAPTEDYVVVETLAVANDVSFPCEKGYNLVIDKKMVLIEATYSEFVCLKYASKISILITRASSRCEIISAFYIWKVFIYQLPFILK